MALTGYIKSLFSDKEKTSPLFPITKTKAVIDDEGKNLDELLGDAIFVDDGTDEATGYVNADTLGGKAEDQLSVANAAALGGKAPEYYVQPRNLLDNSDFRNPINQRGASGYSADGYTVDRWGMWSSGDGSGHGLYIDTVNKWVSFICGTQGYVMFAQGIEREKLTVGKKYTIACDCHINNGSADLRFRAPDGTDVASVVIKSGEITCVSFTMPELTGDPPPQVFIVGYNGTDMGLRNIALYEGEYTAETLPPYVPKGYGAELVECLRYFERNWPNEHLYKTINDSFFSILVHYFPKRIEPTITYNGNNIDGCDMVSYSSCRLFAVNQNNNYVGFVDISADL